MTIYLIVLEDRHTDVHVEAYTSKESVVERFNEIVESYDYEPEEEDDIPEWIAHATLSGEGDAVRVEEIELDTPRDL